MALYGSLYGSLWYEHLEREMIRQTVWNPTWNCLYFFLFQIKPKRLSLVHHFTKLLHPEDGLVRWHWKKNELTGHLWWSERNIMLFILLVSSLLKCWRHYNFPIISPGCSFVHKRAFLFHGLFGWRLIPRKSLVCLSKWLCLYFEEILHLKF